MKLDIKLRIFYFQTCFYFEIERKYFYKALDKFAQFFICPLLLENAVDREIQAVDSGKSISVYNLQKDYTCI